MEVASLENCCGSFEILLQLCIRNSAVVAEIRIIYPSSVRFILPAFSFSLSNKETRIEDWEQRRSSFSLNRILIASMHYCYFFS